MMTTTREVLLDYIRFRLYEEGYCGTKINKIRDMFAGLPLGESPGMDELRFVGRNMECNIYHAAFLDMAEQQFNLIGDNAKEDYMKVLSEIFEDRIINWGRLILVMVYTGRLAVRAMKLDCTKQIRNLVDWCETFFQLNFLDQWIEANGGWDKAKGLSKGDWQRKEMVQELGNWALTLGLLVGIVSTAYFILQRRP